MRRTAPAGNLAVEGVVVHSPEDEPQVGVAVGNHIVEGAEHSHLGGNLLGDNPLGDNQLERLPVVVLVASETHHYREGKIQAE